MNTHQKSFRVLVMGGLGFIGSHLCRHLLKEGYHVRIFDKLYGSTELIADIQQEVDIRNGDIEKSDDVLRALEGMDMVIHLIHTTVPGSSMQDPVYDVLSNVESNAKWLSHLHETNLKRIIYISSGGTVYGIPKSDPIREDHPTDPICSYGITKLAIEKYIAMYANLNGIEYRIGRPSNVYGEGQHLNVGQGVIGVFLDRVLKKEPIQIWGDGTQRRDYLYVDDLTTGVLHLIHHEGPGRVFNISHGNGYSLNELLNIIQDGLQLPVQVEYVHDRGFDTPSNILDSARLKNETGWKPGIDIMEGIRRVYAWLRRF